MIRAIIIDDEPSAVNVLSLLLRKKCSNDVEVLATSNSPQEGKLLMEQLRPDLVFLDVEMPGMSGIELVRSFPVPLFRVVFVTAYNEYAVEAFRLCAVDYLLKPVEAEDVVSVVEKVKKEMSQDQAGFNRQLQNLQQFLESHILAVRKIGIGMADKIIFVGVADIVYCEANGAYTNVHLSNGKKIVASKTLGDFEVQLGSSKFLRIHHSTLINLRRVREFQRFDGGAVIMDNDTKLEVSQRKRKDFLDAINGLVV